MDAASATATATATAALALAPEPQRKTYDSWPIWYQNSLYFNEEEGLILARLAGNFTAQLEAATAFKRKGNANYKNLCVEEAIVDYEMALAVFQWLESKDEDWKKHGIRDDSLLRLHYHCKSDEEEAALRAFQSSCLLNLAVCYQKLECWVSSIQACSTVLELDAKCVKAYYRRAIAHIRPAYCGAQEYQIAWEDLRLALSLAPNDANILATQNNLLNRMKQHKEKEKEKDRGKDKKSLRSIFHAGQASGVSPSMGASSIGGIAAGSAVGTAGEGAKFVSAHLRDSEVSESSIDTDRLSISSSASLSGPRRRDVEKTGRLSAASSSNSLSGFGSASSPSASTSASASASASTSASNFNLPSSAVAGAASAASAAFIDSTGMTCKEALEKIRDMESTAARLEECGDVASARRLQAKIQVLRQDIQSHLKNQAELLAARSRAEIIWQLIQDDAFYRPTLPMIKEAKAYGLDLTDQRVLRMLIELHKEVLAQERQASVSGQGPILDPKLKGNDRRARLNEIITSSMVKVRKAMSKEVALKIVNGLNESTFVKMILARRMGSAFNRIFPSKRATSFFAPAEETPEISPADEKMLTRFLESDPVEIKSILVDQIADDLIALDRDDLARRRAHSTSSLASEDDDGSGSGNGGGSGGGKKAAGWGRSSRSNSGSGLEAFDDGEDDDFHLDSNIDADTRDQGARIYNMLVEKYGGVLELKDSLREDFSHGGLLAGSSPLQQIFRVLLILLVLLVLSQLALDPTRFSTLFISPTK